MTTRRIVASAFLVFGLAGLLASPGIAFAQRSDAGINALKFLDATAEKGGLSSGEKGKDFSSEDAVLGIIGNIVNVILGFIGILFFIQMFYSGFRWMSSGGNEEVVTESRATIKSAVIGIVIVFGAFVVTNFTLNQIASITGPTRPSTPVGGDGLRGDDVYCSYIETGPICQVMSRDACINNIGGDIVSRLECEQISPDTDPNLDVPGDVPDFGDLPEPLGNCRYSLPDECTRRTKSGSRSNITESACAQLANSSCGGGVVNYEWP